MSDEANFGESIWQTALTLASRESELLERVARVLGGHASQGGIVDHVATGSGTDGAFVYRFRNREGEDLIVVTRRYEGTAIRWTVDTPMLDRINETLRSLGDARGEGDGDG